LALDDPSISFDQGEKIISLLEHMIWLLEDQNSTKETSYRESGTLPMPAFGRYERAEYPEISFNVFFDRFKERIENPNGNGNLLYPPNGNDSKVLYDTIAPLMGANSGTIRIYDIKDYESASKTFGKNDVNIYPIDLWLDFPKMFGNSISNISVEARELIADKKLSLFLLLMGESFGCDEHHWIKKLSQSIIGHGLADSKIAISCADLKFNKNYEQWCEDNPELTKQFKFKNVVPFEYFQSLYLLQYLSRTGRWMPEGKPAKYATEGTLKPLSEAEVMLNVPNSDSKKKDFMCMNARIRPHRIAIVSELHRLGMHDNFISLLFRGESTDTILGREKLHTYIKEQFFENEEQVEWFQTMFVKNRLKRRIIMDAHEEVISDDRILNKKYFEESYFSLVTETNFGLPFYDNPKFETMGKKSYNKTMFITEKTFKPLAYFHPILMLGSPGTLAFLQAEGYETFPEMFDESYDLMTDDKERFNAVVNQAYTWSKKSDADKREIYDSVKKKLHHNHEHFIGKYNNLKRRQTNYFRYIGGVLR